MLIDMHTHSSGASDCCQLNAEEIVEAAKNIGVDGIILTNHYRASDCKKFSSGQNYAEHYIKECHNAIAHGERIGLKVFFGIEVTMTFAEGIHLLIYGVKESFLRENPYIFDLSLKELYELVHRNGGILVEGHPFRHDCPILDTTYLDALEINCHPLYLNTHYKVLYDAAKKAGIMLTCGSDYHGDTYRPKCGAYFPDNVKTIEDIANFIKNTGSIKLKVQEIDCEPDERKYTKED
jgi:predicted metal-dependent phosphoesterase TrpH